MRNNKKSKYVFFHSTIWNKINYLVKQNDHDEIFCKRDNLTLGQLSMWTFMIYYYFHEKNNVFFSYECRWAWWFHCCVAAATLASWAWTLAESLWHLPTKILLLADIVGFRKTTFWARALMEFHISMFSYCTNTKKKNEIYVFS